MNEAPMQKYTPTQWDTSSDKAEFEAQFKKFVTGGYKRRDFPKWFYTRLSKCFGHIAHYNEHCFYVEFFTSPEGRRRFNDMTMAWPCYGDPEWTYSDVEKVLKDWMKKLIEDYDNQDEWPEHLVEQEASNGRQ